MVSEILPIHIDAKKKHTEYKGFVSSGVSVGRKVPHALKKMCNTMED